MTALDILIPSLMILVIMFAIVMCMQDTALTSLQKQNRKLEVEIVEMRNRHAQYHTNMTKTLHEVQFQAYQKGLGDGKLRNTTTFV